MTIPGAFVTQTARQTDGNDVPLNVLDEPREKCGLFGTWGDESPARSAYFGLYSLQHRGQESAGIATTNGRSIERHTDMGLVSQVFSPGVLERLDAHAQERQISAGGAIGHNRYSTTGSSDERNAQPFVGFYQGGQVAIGHNGNLVNAKVLRDDLEKKGHAFHTTSDTEVVLQLIAACSGEDGPGDAIADAAAQLRGAFSLVFLFNNRIEALRDPWGWRPLVIGRLDSGGYAVASETVALDVIGATYVRDVEPGEIVTISDDGIASRRYADAATPRAHCVFEHVYFASRRARCTGGRSRWCARRSGGASRSRPRSRPTSCCPCPTRGAAPRRGSRPSRGGPTARGSSQPLRRADVYQADAERACDGRAAQLNVIPDVVRGQRCVVVDDSIVRGTTTRAKMDQLRAAGATEIHLRISCPPIRNPCYFGIDFADREQLIAASNEVEEIRSMLGVDSLHYLSLDGMLEAVSGVTTEPGDYCTACFSGVYPIEVDPNQTKDVLSKKC